MAMLHFFIEGPGTSTRITVDDQMVVGACVSWLVSRRGYPRRDNLGTLIRYQLRPLSGGGPLPHTARFADVRLPSGTSLALECERAQDTTVPIGPLPPPASTREPMRLSRRALLSATPLLALCALTGAGAGVIARIAPDLRKQRTALPTTPAGQPPHVARARFTFTAHQRTVRALAWSPDGTRLASGGDDAQVLVWATDGTQLAQLPHPAPVAALAWSPDGTRLVTGSANQVTFFALPAGTILARSTHRHTAPVTGVAWAAHGQMPVASCAADQRVIIWETAQYQPQTVFTRHDTAVNAVSFAADGQIVASASQGGAVRVWLASTGQEVHPFYWDAHLPLRAGAFAPVGTLLAVGGDDGIIRIWKGTQCQTTAESSDGLLCSDIPLRLHASSAAICTLAWSPDGRSLLSGSNDGSLVLWSPFQQQQPYIPVQRGGPVRNVSWAPSGAQWAATSGNNVVIWQRS